MISTEQTKQSERKMGLSVLGDVPFGTHLCLFYKSKEDLIDILVPYFKAGLENNEFCMWVTCEPLSTQDAKRAMRKALPNFAQYVRRGQIQIIPHTEWYFKDGTFNLQRVLKSWIGKLDQALAHGYDGIRVTGDTAWLENRNWRAFAEYEERANRVIDQYPMLAICSYCIDKCGVSEALDVANSHQCALIKREGTWKLIESSERNKAEEEMGKLARFPAENPNPVLRIAKDGTILYANDASSPVLQTWGRNNGQCLPEPCSKRVQDALSSDKVRTFEFECYDGRIFFVTLAPLVCAGYVNAYGIDITDWKRAEEALRASESNYRTLLENLPQKIFLKDRESVYLSCNENYAQDLKIKAGEIAGTTDYDFYPKELAEKYRADDRRIIGSGDTKDIEEKYIVDGRKFFVHTVKTPVRDEQGNVAGILGIFWDITERKQLEKLLRESEKLAAKGQLAAQIAHEINNPLAGIKNSLLLVTEGITKGHPCYQYVDLIDKEIERVSDIVRQMFTLYRPNETMANEFSVDDAIRDVVVLLEPTCRRYNAVISIDRSNESAVVTLPETLIRQILFNIVKNAMEASPKGAQVKVGATATEKTLTLAVSDQGDGIPEQWRDRVFEVSFTTKKNQTTSGLGFGLSVTKNIVESMGGYLRFESKKGQGTVFTIVIPLGGTRKVAQYG